MGRGGMVASHLPMAQGEEVGIAHTRHGIEADAQAQSHGGVGVLPIGGCRRGGGRGSSRRGVHPRTRDAPEMLRSESTGIGNGAAVAHVGHEFGPVADEVLVVEGARPAAAGVPAEAPSVQLPNERFVLPRFEVPGKNLGGQVERLEDDEGLAAGEPFDHLLGLGKIEDFTELYICVYVCIIK